MKSIRRFFSAAEFIDNFRVEALNVAYHILLNGEHCKGIKSEQRLGIPNKSLDPFQRRETSFRLSSWHRCGYYYIQKF